MARLVFGLLTAVLCTAGAVWFATRVSTGNVVMRAGFVTLLGSVACFGLFNVALGRAWRWPARLIILSFVATFLARVTLGP